MRFVSYTPPASESCRTGLLCGTGVVDVASLGVDAPAHMPELIDWMTDARCARLAACAEEVPAGNRFSLEEVCLRAPLPQPGHDILCVGVNYADHRAEGARYFDRAATGPGDIAFFSKRCLWATGPDATLDGQLELDPHLDYEVELAVVIGKQGRDIAPEQAEEYIFGYTVLNDFSARTLQKRHGQWFKGKSLDGFTAMGPCIVHRSALPLPLDLRLCTRVNGEVRQEAGTGQMLADIPTILAILSSGMTLVPGDVIATGTPAGVGMGSVPPVFLQRGDVVECEIESIGVLRTTIG